MLARPCSENIFWETVEPFGWGVTTTHWLTIKLALMRRLSIAEAEALQARLHLLTNALHKKLQEEHIEIEVGSDSYNDLLAHVVGMGRETYQKALQEPKTVQQRGHKGDFTESFEYALPHQADYAYLTLDHYKTSATRLLETYNAANTNAAFAPVHNQLHLVVVALRCLERGAVDEALQHEALTRGAANEIAAYYKQMGATFGAHAVDGGSVGNPHGVHNLFTDLRTYYLAFLPKDAAAPPALKSDWTGTSVSVVGGDFDSARGKIT